MRVYRDTSIMNIEVKFDGEEIIVTKPGTDFMLAYRKRPESPTLKLTRSWVNPHTTSPAVNEFRAQAFQVAVSKSRELGWIAWVSRSPGMGGRGFVNRPERGVHA